MFKWKMLMKLFRGNKTQTQIFLIPAFCYFFLEKKAKFLSHIQKRFIQRLPF